MDWPVWLLVELHLRDWWQSALFSSGQIHCLNGKERISLIKLSLYPFLHFILYPLIHHRSLTNDAVFVSVLEAVGSNATSNALNSALPIAVSLVHPTPPIKLKCRTTLCQRLKGWSSENITNFNSFIYMDLQWIITAVLHPPQRRYHHIMTFPSWTIPVINSWT